MKKKIIDGLKFLSDFYHFIIADEECKKILIKDAFNVYNITFALCVLESTITVEHTVNNTVLFIFALISFMINILRIFQDD